MASNPRTLVFLVLSVATAMLLSPEVAADDVPAIVTVNVNNDLGGNVPLTIHCWAKGDDQQVLALKYSESVQWQVMPTPDQSGLYSCSMRWKSKTGWMGITIEAYNEKQDQQTCATTCLWRAKYDGIHRFDETQSKYVLAHWWEPIVPGESSNN